MVVMEILFKDGNARNYEITHINLFMLCSIFDSPREGGGLVVDEFCFFS